MHRPTGQPDSDEATCRSSEPHSGSASAEELATFVRTNLIRAVIGLAIIAAILGVIAKLYEEELLSVAESVYSSVGVPGLLAVVFATDAVFSPMPPDVVLVVIANSQLHQRWMTLLPIIGLVSAAAGCTGWFIGGKCAEIKRIAPWVDQIKKKHGPTLERFDGWAVVLGALTPLPFSVICLTAGALGMRLQRLAPLTLFRIPKFVLFYWVIYWSTHVGG